MRFSATVCCERLTKHLYTVGGRNLWQCEVPAMVWSDSTSQQRRAVLDRFRDELTLSLCTVAFTARNDQLEVFERPADLAPSAPAGSCTSGPDVAANSSRGAGGAVRPDSFGHKAHQGKRGRGGGQQEQASMRSVVAAAAAKGQLAQLAVCMTDSADAGPMLASGRRLAQLLVAAVEPPRRDPSASSLVHHDATASLRHRVYNSVRTFRLLSAAM